MHKVKCTAYWRKERGVLSLMPLQRKRPYYGSTHDVYPTEDNPIKVRMLHMCRAAGCVIIMMSNPSRDDH